MKKAKVLVTILSVVLVSSCVLKKEHVALKTKYEEAGKELTTTKDSLQKCIVVKEKNEVRVFSLTEQVKSLKEDKKNAINQVDNLTLLTQSSSDNIKNVITQLSEKDKYINGIKKAMTKRDSLNLAIKFHLTRNLTKGIQDKDIEVNVEKTVVFITISDKLLFKSGSYDLSSKANSVLEKIAKVINDQPSMEVIIEGHTDSNPIKTKFLKDNWDLSAKRATSITRLLQHKFGVSPERLIAAGRSQYVPLVDNDSPTNMAKNRRTKIIIMPKLNQFFKLLEQDNK